MLTENDSAIQGLYACGEMLGGVFYGGYPGGGRNLVAEEGQVVHELLKNKNLFLESEHQL